MRYLMTFSYNGSKYNGYQKQPGNLKTIQGEIENALTYINGGKTVEIFSSGRTDKKVHALGQTAHFDLDMNISLEKLKRAINSNISDDIHVIKIEQVNNDFHARYDAISKKYVYSLNMGEFNPLEKDFVYQWCRNLDVNLMKKGIFYFIGKHNFKLFVGGDTKKTNYEREIFDAFIEQEGDILSFTFIGDGFMQYQIRNMVGTLIKVGQRKIKPEQIKDMFDGNGKNLIYCADGCGLRLVEVRYR